jgi:prepilin-type processing-associated H-X9-DG protein
MYGQNYQMAGNVAAGTWIMRKIVRVNNPQAVYELMDAASGQQVTNNITTSNIRPRHGSAPYDQNTAYPGAGSPSKRLNVGFLDGHVQGMPYSDLAMGATAANAVQWKAGLGTGGCYCTGTCAGYCNQE